MTVAVPVDEQMADETDRIFYSKTMQHVPRSLGVTRYVDLGVYYSTICCGGMLTAEVAGKREIA
jgi:hypothetical protein